MKKGYPANKRYTQSEFVKIARELGWTVTESRGKGSHYWPPKRDKEVSQSHIKSPSEWIKQ